VSTVGHALGVDDVRAGRALRALRLRREWTQAELGARAAVSQSVVSLAERGHFGTLALRTVRGLFAAVDARYSGVVTWRGGALDRLLDARHAGLVEAVVAELIRLGWKPLVEVSFNHYGDRGAIDVLAVQPPSRCGLVVEVKSELTAIEETNRRLDVKVRLAPALIEERFAMRPTVVGRLLVLPRSTTSVRRVSGLGATFSAALPARTVEVRRWLQNPTGGPRRDRVCAICQRTWQRTRGSDPMRPQEAGFQALLPSNGATCPPEW